MSKHLDLVLNHVYTPAQKQDIT